MENRRDLNRLRRLIAASRHCVAFTGAGVSALSGIPAFRGPGGIFERPESPDAPPPGFLPPLLTERAFCIGEFEQNPEYFYKLAGPLVYTVHEKTPSPVHNALAALEQKGILKAVITQNIDGLHQKAGSRRVIEIHGSPRVHYCLRCAGIRVPYESAASLVAAGRLPLCPQCGRPLKPAITFYGEPLPLDARRAACAEAQSADLLLVLGTGLQVNPAAELPRLTLARGGKLVIVNSTPATLDAQAALRFSSLEDVFEGIGLGERVRER
ncbi:MAG: NAD-dependent deacetylase [Spirochaetaceae bacterium]|nr:NAD-dependent deacetylase [Spirochaetaceae bacterium]